MKKIGAQFFYCEYRKPYFYLALFFLILFLLSFFPHRLFHIGSFFFLFIGIAFLSSSCGIVGFRLGQIRFFRMIRLVLTLFFFAFVTLFAIPLVKGSVIGIRTNDHLEKELVVSSKPVAVILLGTQVTKRGAPSLLLLRRIELALDQWQNVLFPLSEKKKIQFEGFYLSGGKGKNSLHSEAEVIKSHLSRSGIPQRLLFEENRATSTKENIAFLLEQYPQLKECQLIFISSHFHLFRAQLIATHQGIENPIMLGAKVDWRYLFSNGFREELALIKTVLWDI